MNLKDIIKHFKRCMTYEGTVSHCNVYVEETEDSYIVSYFHIEPLIICDYDSEMYRQRKRWELHKTEKEFRKNLVKNDYIYEMINGYTYKIKKEKLAKGTNNGNI